MPVLIFVAVIAGGEGASGWAIPAATDIAFAIGVIALLGDRIPAGVKLLLLAIAIVDDLIAISLIAVFYSEGISLGWLVVAAAVLGGVVGLRAAGVRSIPVYVAVGVAAWVAMHESGARDDRRCRARAAVSTLAPSTAGTSSRRSSTGCIRSARSWSCHCSRSPTPASTSARRTWRTRSRAVLRGRSSSGS